MTRPEIVVAEDAAHLEALVRLSSWAFGFSVDLWRRVLDRAGPGAARVALVGGEVAGGLFLVPMGQFFGGRSVPMVGVGGVAVVPEHRGHGVGTALMRATLDELGRGGVALSSLFPETERLYRSVGYEVSGVRHRYAARPVDLGRAERGLDVRGIEAGDEAALADLYRQLAVVCPGHLDRGPYIWAWVRRHDPSAVRGWIVEDRGRIEGYIYVAQTILGRARYELEVTDVAARSKRAARRILALLGSHGSIAERVVWHGDLSGPLHWAFEERRYQGGLAELWMTRVVDVAAALEARGYPAGVRAEISLEVEDDLLEQNRGTFLLSVAEGRGAVRRDAGPGALRVDVRGLAPLFTGLASPASLEARGLLAGDRDAADLAATMFAGPAPWMADRF